MARLEGAWSLSILNFEELKAYDSNAGGNASELDARLESLQRSFEMWLNNIGKIDEPLFLPGMKFVHQIILVIQKQLPKMKTAAFFVYLDEFENLLEYQQEIINTYIKHGQCPLVFNIAIKRNGFSTKKTVGVESIIEEADYRKQDLEEVLGKKFELFAAEIFFLNLKNAGYEFAPISRTQLRKREDLGLRREAEYEKRVISEIQNVLPRLSHEDVAKMILSNPTLRRRLEKQLMRASGVGGKDEALVLEAFEKLLDPDLPKAAIVNAVLIGRSSIDLSEMLDEMKKLKEGVENKYSGKTSWINNNFAGSVYLLYDNTNNICPLYAGFETFCMLASSNLRHFMELCHRSVKGVSLSGGRLVVPVETQLEAAYSVSVVALGEIRSFGNFGHKLHTLVLRIGTLFELAHQNPLQSEAEINHFSINKGGGTVSEGMLQILDEAVKWSVFFEQIETKQKDSLQQENHEYVLNPVYAVRFGISYRKKRKLDLAVSDFEVLVDGGLGDFKSLLDSYRKKWNVDISDTNPDLFSHFGIADA